VVETATELGGRHLLGHRGRPADVSEEDAAVDLGTAVVLAEEVEAAGAHRRVRLRRPLAERPHQRRTGSRERRRAELAAR
jgi:hypothetical protein